MFGKKNFGDAAVLWQNTRKNGDVDLYYFTKVHLGVNLKKWKNTTQLTSSSCVHAFFYEKESSLFRVPLETIYRQNNHLSDTRERLRKPCIVVTQQAAATYFLPYLAHLKWRLKTILFSTEDIWVLEREIETGQFQSNVIQSTHWW